MMLFDAYDLGPLALPHRVVMAPMTRNRATDTLPNALMAQYYRQRASAAFIITEATQVDPMGQGYPNTPGIHSPEQVAGWQQVTDAVHEAGGRLFLQLWHVGRISHPSYHGGALPVAPSAVAADASGYTADFEQAPYPTPRALALDEIPDVVAQFARGARMAKDAGFDGVEIHGANGYLIDQFLESGTNHRTDAYGGPVAHRARLLLEVTEAVLGVWDAERVGVRLSPGGAFNDMHDDDPEETFGYAAEQLSGYGLGYLHGVQGEVAGTTAAKLLRAHYDGTLVMAGGYDRASGEAAVADGTADLVAYARYFLANPDLPRRFREDAPTNDWDEDTFYSGTPEGYIDYPTLDEVEA